ncbi:MAG: hypothetical protein ACTHZ5_03850 [Micrococcaceae bacterium]
MSTIHVESVSADDIRGHINDTLASVGLSREQLEAREEDQTLTVEEMRALARVRRFEFLITD